MDKSLFIHQAKADLQELIKDITLENITEKRTLINRYIDLIEMLKDIVDTKESPEIPKDATFVEPIEQGRSDHALDNINEEPRDNNSEQLYVFERRLRGGFVPELETVVSESAVRGLNLRHGDLLRVTNVSDDGTKKRYRFGLGKRVEDVQSTDRVEIRYCVVEDNYGQLVVRDMGVLLEGDKRPENLPETYILRDKDIVEFEIISGDIVDIAFFAPTPDYIRVIFKHHPSVSGSRQESVISSAVRQKELVVDNEVKNFPKELLDKRVLVIGCEPRKAVYKERFEALGAKFDWTKGSVDAKSMSELPAKIKKADIVLILIDFIRHRASKDAVAKCKEENVPYTIIDGLGVKTIIEGALELVQRTEAAS